MPDKVYTALCVSNVVAQQDMEDLARINALVHAMRGTLGRVDSFDSHQIGHSISF